MILSHLSLFLTHTQTTEIYTLSLHDALPISGPSCRFAWPTGRQGSRQWPQDQPAARPGGGPGRARARPRPAGSRSRSEEHTSELQSRQYLVCRLLLDKKTMDWQPAYQDAASP